MARILAQRGEYIWRDDYWGRLLWAAQWVDNEESRKQVRRVLKYGISPTEFERLGFAQNWQCAGCNVQFSGDLRGLRIDHCHATGNVRGLLCRDCNVALGWARDDSARLRRLANYLDGNKRRRPANG